MLVRSYLTSSPQAEKHTSTTMESRTLWSCKGKRTAEPVTRGRWVLHPCSAPCAMSMLGPCSCNCSGTQRATRASEKNRAGHTPSHETVWVLTTE